MSLTSDAAESLAKALNTVPDLSTTTDPGDALSSPPAAVLGAPRLTWETGCLEPTGAQFPVFLVVDANEFAVERLWQLVEDVAKAVDQHMADAVVLSADPGTFPTGTSQLPMYELTIEVSL